MKLHPEDPSLTAYVLGELEPAEASAVELAAAADPELQTMIREVEESRRLLTTGMKFQAVHLLPGQRESIRCSAREPSRVWRAGASISRRSPLRRWLIPASIAAGFIIAASIISLKPAGGGNPFATIPQTPAPAEDIPVTRPVVPPALPAPLSHGSLTAADFPTLVLPLPSGSSNISSISESILTNHQLPAPDAVRLEELLNHFSIRLNGVIAIARQPATRWHPDERASGVSAPCATLSTEMIACPWKPSATLLLISIHGNPRNDCEVKIAFHANPQNVLRYRLLGFNPCAGRDPGNPSPKLAANSTAMLAIEIEPFRPASELGMIEWSADDRAAPPISLVHSHDADPSDDARFAAPVCAYAQWLTGEQGTNLDADILAALAREIATTTLAADRADFLSLVDRSLHL